MIFVTTNIRQIINILFSVYPWEIIFNVGEEWQAVGCQTW